MNKTRSIFALTAALGVSVISSSAPAQTVNTFRSDVASWTYEANGARSYAFDSYYPGVDGKGDLTGPTVSIDLDSTTLTVRRHDPGGALRDASLPFGWVSDAPLYATSGPGCTWTFSTPIYGMYVYYGSLSIASNAAMRLYSNGALVDIVTRYGGSQDGVYAVGMGFTSQTPIDTVEFWKSGAGDSVLVGAFVGLVPGEPSLGTVRIPGYQGPLGDVVEYDFAITTEVPNPFKLTVGTLTGGQPGTFNVVGGQPNSRTYLIYSMVGRGSVYIRQLNVTAGIVRPILAASKNTNAAGEANWTLPIPANSRGRDVWFQALQIENASTVVATWVQ